MKKYKVISIIVAAVMLVVCFGTNVFADNAGVIIGDVVDSCYGSDTANGLTFDFTGSLVFYPSSYSIYAVTSAECVGGTGELDISIYSMCAVRYLDGEFVVNGEIGHFTISDDVNNDLKLQSAYLRCEPSRVICGFGGEHHVFATENQNLLYWTGFTEREYQISTNYYTGIDF